MTRAARIYQPARTATQSGRGKTHVWVLEFEPAAPREVEPLMGWTASADMDQEVRLSFPSRDAALDYAKRHDIAATVQASHARTVLPKSYSDNFRFDRVEARAGTAGAAATASDAKPRR